MSSLRRTLFPILLALLALAIGIALGGGPLQSNDGTTNTAALREATVVLRDKAASLRAAGVFDEAVNQALSPKLLAGRLHGRGVTLIVLPGVAGDTVAATQRALKQAGAQICVVAKLDAKLIDPGKKTYVDSVASSSLKGVADLARLAHENTYVRAGALLARAYVGQGADANIDDEASKIDSELQGAKLVAVDGSPVRRGTFVAVVAPGTHGSDSFTTAQMTISHDLVTALVQGSDAVVVGSTPGSASAGGLIDVLARDKTLASRRLSTVDVVDSAAGQTALVYGLVAAASGSPGHFGVDGDGPLLPPGLGSTAD